MKCPTWIPALLVSLSVPGSLQATPYLDGAVGYDYYVSGVDDDGFELVDAGLFAEAVVNDSPTRSGPLSLSGWLTRNPSPSGAGVEAGYLPIGTLPGYGEVSVDENVPADDVRPGEYHVHMLLQDDRYPGTWEDSRALPPTLLWRGGLEAVGPLRLYQYESGWLEVEFDAINNRRIDGRYTNTVALRLLATYGFGPASDGLVLCERTVPGLYAGDARLSPSFGCYPNAAPDGEYTLHLEVAELGGRGGYSTLTGPDAYFRDGWVQRFHGCSACFAHWPGGHDTVYYAGGLGLGALLPMLLLGWRRGGAGARQVLAGLMLLPAAVAAAPGGDFSDAELDQMLAPIALYPDSVLSNVLIAATYPLEVAQAARWARQHPDLDGDAALAAVEGKGWDDSVKALVAFPELLERMDEDLEWTRDLGEAFLAQDAQVMDRIQVLRHRADDAGNLERAEHIEVVREREVIYIEPAVARRVYIPYYDPWVVYGSWWWPAYPPYAWSFWAGHPVGYYARYRSPFYWGSWVVVSRGFYFTAFNWHLHQVVVVPRHHHGHVRYRAHDIVRHHGARHWKHDAHHRRQVEYRHQRLSHRSEEHRVQRRDTVERGEYRQRAAQRSSTRPGSPDRPAQHSRESRRSPSTSYQPPQKRSEAAAQRRSAPPPAQAPQSGSRERSDHRREERREQRREERSDSRPDRPSRAPGHGSRDDRPARAERGDRGDRGDRGGPRDGGHGRGRESRR